MTSCTVCQKIQKKQDVLYEDEHLIALLDDKPATPGQMQLIPKEHYPIIEVVPDFIVGNMFVVANKLSTVAFETLGAEGTNLVVQNGLTAGQHDPHFLVNIIPRKQGDGVDFTWQAQELPDDEASTLALQISEETKAIGGFQKEKAQPLQIDTPQEQVEGDEETNYMIRQLRRIP